MVCRVQYQLTYSKYKVDLCKPSETTTSVNEISLFQTTMTLGWPSPLADILRTSFFIVFYCVDSKVDHLISWPYGIPRRGGERSTILRNQIRPFLLVLHFTPGAQNSSLF